MEKHVSESVSIDVYYDYGCPYVYAAAIWLRDLQCKLGDGLEINWKYFPLEQVNSGEDEDWKLWEQPLSFTSRGRTAFHGAIAARRQGEEAFEKFHFALLDAKHVDGQNLGRRQVVVEVAKSAGLDIEAFERDLDDVSLLADLGEDYEEGRSEYGVFGTPTLVFANGEAAYLKMRPAPEKERTLEVWAKVRALIEDEPDIAEIKRPIKPTGDD